MTKHRKSAGDAAQVGVTVDDDNKKATQESLAAAVEMMLADEEVGNMHFIARALGLAADMMVELTSSDGGNVGDVAATSASVIAELSAFGARVGFQVPLVGAWMDKARTDYIYPTAARATLSLASFLNSRRINVLDYEILVGSFARVIHHCGVSPQDALDAELGILLEPKTRALHS